MKILQVVHGFPPYNFGGAEVYAYNLSREIASRHKVAIFHRINDPGRREYSVKHRASGNLEIFTINNTFRQYSSFEMTYKNSIIAKKLGLVLDHVHPDIVHIQHLLYLSIQIVDEIKKRNIPIIFTLHDYFLICPQGQLFKNNTSLCLNGQCHTSCLDCVYHQLSIKKYVFYMYYLLEKYFRGLLIRPLKQIYLNACRCFSNKANLINLIEDRKRFINDACKKVDLFIAPSNFLKERFIQAGIPKNRMIHLDYGFDAEMFKMYCKVGSGKLRFGFIGNMIPAKGLHLLVRCFNKIENANVELKIYGQQNSYKGILVKYRQNIEKLAKNSNIKFMGSFDNKDISNVFSEIDVLIVPSVWYENSPLVIHEAFLAKTPVIAADIGGIPELVKDNINGLLFRPNDVEDLYKKIQLFIDDPGYVKRLERNITNVKTIRENADELEGLYLTLAGKEK